jgi:adenine deaminase
LRGTGLDEFGTVAAGRRADLILIEADPLEDVANAAKRAGVMLRGRWLDEAELQEVLRLLADKYVRATEYLPKHGESYNDKSLCKSRDVGDDA